MKIRSYILSTIAFLVCAMSLSFSAYGSDSGSSLWPASDKSIGSVVEYQSQIALKASPASTVHYHPALNDVSSHSSPGSFDMPMHELSVTAHCFAPVVEQPVDNYAVFWLKLPDVNAIASSRHAKTSAKPSMRHLSSLRFPKFTGRSYQPQSTHDIVLA